MYLDAFTLSALADEFLDTLVGGRIQDVLDVDETGIGMEIYQHHRRRYLYLSADNQMPRVHVVPEKLRRGLPKPMQLGLLLRRFAEGGGLTHVYQPPWERLLHFEIEGAEGAVTLIIEPMERRSNLLLVRDGIVMDCLRRVGADENRYRVSLPNHPYQPPPPQTGKADPRSLSLEAIGALLSADDTRKLHQRLTGALLGVSPLVAREIVYRATGDASATAAEVDRLADAVHQVIDPLARREWQPGIIPREGDPASAEAFSVYPLTYRPGWTPIGSVSEALTAFFHAPVGEDAYNAGKTPLREAIGEGRARLSARLASLQRSMTDDAERETMRQKGELLLAYQYTLAPGQTELSAVYEEDKPPLTIAIDPTITPLENAQRYFERYNKAKRALDDVPGLIKHTQTDLAVLAQLETDLDLAANYPEIDEVQTALQARGLWHGKPAPRSTGMRSTPLRLVTRDGFVIWVGRNSRQNEQVTFDKGGPQDLWLHARGVPGAHVIIKFDGRQIPEDAIERAAELAAYYSANRTEGKVTIDVTYRRNVRKINGAGPGMVTYRGEETRLVTPRGKADES